jgi:predicted metal-dependent phosphotriesterase family hydrolase
VTAVTTVLGPIVPAALGVTYVHDHLLAAPPEWSRDREDADLTLLSLEDARSELSLFRQAGGQALVEMSPPDYHRQPEGLRDLARLTGIHIIMTSGLHKEAFSRPLTDRATIDELSTRFAAEVQQGVDGTGIRAGLLKAATSLDTITPGEDKVLRAVSRAHLATGAPISTHTQAGTMGLEQLALFKTEGVDPGRVAIGHVDRKPDLDYHRAMLDAGAYLIYDQISKEKYVPDRVRVQLLIALVREGYGDRLMLSNDFARVSNWTSTGGGPGLTYILWRFIPWLIAEGMPREAAWAMLVQNPAKFFAF